MPIETQSPLHIDKAHVIAWSLHALSTACIIAGAAVAFVNQNQEAIDMVGLHKQASLILLIGGFVLAVANSVGFNAVVVAHAPAPAQPASRGGPLGPASVTIFPASNAQSGAVSISLLKVLLAISVAIGMIFVEIGFVSPSQEQRVGLTQIAEDAATLDAATATSATASPAKVHELAKALHGLAVNEAISFNVPTSTAR